VIQITSDGEESSSSRFFLKGEFRMAVIANSASRITRTEIEFETLKTISQAIVGFAPESGQQTQSRTRQQRARRRHGGLR
jgi:hypothetical protein